MGLSTRILLRICLPAAVLVLGLGITYHYANREQQIAAAQERLQQSANTISEMIAYRCDEIALQLTEIIADDDAASAIPAQESVASNDTRLARTAIVSDMRLALRHDARLLRLDLYDGHGMGVVGVDSAGKITHPKPAGGEPWFESTRSGGQYRWCVETPGDRAVAHVSVGLRSSQTGQQIVGAALVDFEQLALPAIQSATRLHGPVRVRVECDSGRVQFGPTSFDQGESLLRAQSPSPCFDGRVLLDQPRDQVLAGLLSFERDAFIVSLLLIMCIATLLWTGMRALVLSPLRGMLAAIEAFEAGLPIPPPARGSRPSGELALLDGTLRGAFEASVEGRQRLQELNNSLETRVRQRTAELEHNANALRLARDDAREANEAKSSFVANVSHEVRTPLNAIIGMTGMLADTPLNKDQEECVETVRQAGENLLSLINHVLDFSKIEAGRLELEHIDFDLGETLDGITSLLGPSARQKGFPLSCSVAESCPSQLRGDPTRLRQVLVNLVGNAIKFTHAGSVRLVASLEQDGELWAATDGAEPSEGLMPSDDRTALRFEVTDSGIGISPEAQERLFTPFSQAEESTTRQFGGTGLGLAICKQIVERMGGRIGVRSEAGKGSTFWCLVPLEAQAAQEMVGPAPSTQRWELSGLRVLIASFQPASRRLLEQTLAACGTRTDTASTPAAALRMAQQAFATGQGFHAALLDENLPEEGADGLAKLVRVDPALAGMPLLLMTRTDEQETARQAGFDLALAKPLNTVHLVDALCAVISRSGNHGTERTTPAPAPTSATDSAPALATPPPPPAERQDRAPAPPTASPTAASGPSPAQSPAPEGSDAADSRGRGWLLLAEDNLVNQRVATRVLEKLEFRVDVVGDGAAAVDAVTRNSYDAVLMDLQMPVMDGYEAVRRIRAAEVSPAHLPIIALTAHAMAGDRERALQDGLDDYICKPVRPADLAAVLDRWLGGSASTPTTEPAAVTRPEEDT